MLMEAPFADTNSLPEIHVGPQLRSRCAPDEGKRSSDGSEGIDNVPLCRELAWGRQPSCLFDPAPERLKEMSVTFEQDGGDANSGSQHILPGPAGEERLESIAAGLRRTRE